MGRSARLTVIADTGALYALVDASDRWHESVTAWWAANEHEILIPEPALPEICYLLQRRIGPHAETDFVRALADGNFESVSLEATDNDRIVSLMEEYEDLPLGYVDAAVIAVSERLDCRHILTTDRKHFGAVRPRHVRSFYLFPQRTA